VDGATGGCGRFTLSRLAAVAFASSVSFASVVRSSRSDASTSPSVAVAPTVPARWCANARVGMVRARARARATDTGSKQTACGSRQLDRAGSGCRGGAPLSSVAICSFSAASFASAAARSASATSAMAKTAWCVSLCGE
jgi:hypothetical protein